MKDSNHRGKSVQPKSDFYRAFLGLDRNRRRSVALRMLRNQRLLADLYDHFLIQRALEEGARSICWTAYERSSLSHQSAISKKPEEKER